MGEKIKYLLVFIVLISFSKDFFPLLTGFGIIIASLLYE